MNDSWDERRKAKEDEYFEKEKQRKLEKLRERAVGEVRKSPITGEPMEQLELMGVTIDRCKTSGGIWLDKGELEQILEKSRGESQHNESHFVTNFLRDLFNLSK